MGGDLSKVQLAHVRELREVVRRNYFYFNSKGQAKQLNKKDCSILLSYLWEKIPSYPESGSLKIETWQKIGEYLHQSPRAPPHILTSWRAVINALQIQAQPLLKALVEPPTYSEVTILPPKQPADVATVNHGKLYPCLKDCCLSSTASDSLPATKSNLITETLKAEYEAGNLTAEELQTYPVTMGMDAHMNPVREWKPLPLRTLREIKAAVKDYGLKNRYTMGILEAAGYAHMMIPADWKALMQMILTPSQYVIWDSQYRLQAIQRGTAQIVPDQLYGSGGFTTVDSQRDNIPNEAFPVILMCVFEALRKVDESGKAGSSFTKIKQSNSEPYDEFINKLKSAIEKQIDNEAAAEEILLKLAVENANSDCRRVLEPLVGSGRRTLPDYLQACRVGGQYKGERRRGECKKTRKIFLFLKIL